MNNSLKNNKKEYTQSRQKKWHDYSSPENKIEDSETMEAMNATVNWISALMC